MPEELNQGVASTTSPGAAPAAPETPSSPTSAASPGAAPAPSSTPGAVSTPASDYATVRDTLKNYGLDLGGQFQDDHAVLQHLAGIYRERQQLAPLAQYGQVYLQHADRFNAWMREQQEAAQRQQTQSQAWWKPPEYDPSWASKLTRDPATGEIKPIPGADPSVVQKYMAWVEHQRSFQERFAQDPIKAIQPGLEQLIDQRAQQMIQQHLGGYQQQVQARQLIEQNAAWIHARDQQGNVVMGQNGRPALSEWGQRYAGYVNQAEQMGLRDTMAQHNYAFGLVQRDFLATRAMGQNQAQQAATQGDVAKQQFLAQAGAGVHTPGVAPGQAVGPNGAPANPPRGGGLRGLQELMLRNMQANGFQPGTELALTR